MSGLASKAAVPAVLPAVVQNKWLVTAAIGFGSLMGSIDLSIVNVALPQIRGSIGATIQEITWISTGYAVAMVIVMPLTAFLGRRFGQKRLYLFCLGVFVAGSALCGMARTLTTLVLFRFLQGLGAGALQPTQQAILRQTFPPREQAMAMALFGMAIMLGPAAGPTLGGYIVDNWHWSWIFFINLPVGVIAYVMVSLFVHEDPDILAKNAAQAAAERRSIDWIGIVLLAVGLSALEYFLEEGAAHGWLESPVIATCLGVWSVSLVAFVIREMTIPVPAVNLRLFREPVFASGTLIGAVMFLTLMASMFLFPVFMQELLGFSAFQSGLVLMPRVLAMLVAMPLVGWIYARTDPRGIIATGIALNVIGAWIMGRLTLESGPTDILIPNVIQGIGFACLFVPLATVALSKVPRHRLADAAGLNSLLRQVGGAVGLAIFASLLTNGAIIARGALRAHLTTTSTITQGRLAAIQAALASHGVDPVTAKSTAVAALSGTVARQSLALSFEKMFLLGGLLFAFVFPLLFLLRIDRKALSSSVHVE
jgi:DHA2 family multidrug resistance protein